MDKKVAKKSGNPGTSQREKRSKSYSNKPKKRPPVNLDTGTLKFGKSSKDIGA